MKKILIKVMHGIAIAILLAVGVDACKLLNRDIRYLQDISPRNRQPFSARDILIPNGINFIKCDVAEETNISDVFKTIIAEDPETRHNGNVCLLSEAYAKNMVSDLIKGIKNIKDMQADNLIKGSTTVLPGLIVFINMRADALYRFTQQQMTVWRTINFLLPLMVDGSNTGRFLAFRIPKNMLIRQNVLAEIEDDVMERLPEKLRSHKPEVSQDAINAIERTIIYYRAIANGERQIGRDLQDISFLTAKQTLDLLEQRITKEWFATLFMNIQLNKLNPLLKTMPADQIVQICTRLAETSSFISKFAHYTAPTHVFQWLNERHDQSIDFIRDQSCLSILLATKRIEKCLYGILVMRKTYSPEDMDNRLKLCLKSFLEELSYEKYIEVMQLVTDKDRGNVDFNLIKCMIEATSTHLVLLNDELKWKLFDAASDITDELKVIDEFAKDSQNFKKFISIYGDDLIAKLTKNGDECIRNSNTLRHLFKGSV